MPQLRTMPRNRTPIQYDGGPFNGFGDTVIPYNASGGNNFSFDQESRNPNLGADFRMLPNQWSPAPVGVSTYRPPPRPAMIGVGHGGDTYGAYAQPATDYFNEFGTIRDNTRTIAQDALNNYETRLNEGISGYETTSGGLIDAQAAALAGLTGGYRTQSESALAEDEARRRASRLSLGSALKMGVRNAQSSAARTAKALSAQRGFGSGLLKYTAGLNATAEADAANRMSAAEREDAIAMGDLRRARDSQLLGLDRSDLSSIYGDRSRLTGDVFGSRQNALGTIYGEQSRINTNDANALRSDITQTRLITPTEGPLTPYNQPLYPPSRLPYRGQRRYIA